MKFKTLKDLEAENIHETGEFGVSSYDLKQEAIKWIKEDIREYENMFRDVLKGRKIISPKMDLIKRWMKRLDIVEEDLK